MSETKINSRQSMTEVDDEKVPPATEDRTLSWYAPREPLVLIVLTAITVVFFISVSALSSVYHTQLESRGGYWFTQGSSDLKRGQLKRAMADFHTALTYSPGNYAYELSLAQALLALDKTDEAYAYLISLWQRQPENGTVDLELARIFADKGEVNQAIRYYHNAIYAVWSDKSGGEQRAVRLELVTFLLRHDVKSEAESELIALAGDLPENASLRAHIGDLFMQVPDYERALDEYRESLKLDRRNSEALAGAGQAAFELARYSLAEHYLTEAVALDAHDEQSQDLLHTAQLVLKMDPYQLRFTTAQRNQLVVEAFKIAGQRLKSCPEPVQPAASAATPANATAPAAPTLYSRWSAMRPHVTERGLRMNPDLGDDAMSLVFSIEQQTSIACGPPKGEDLALLLISKLHEAS